jgi:hypothetical protein
VSCYQCAWPFDIAIPTHPHYRYSLSLDCKVFKSTLSLSLTSHA